MSATARTRVTGPSFPVREARYGTNRLVVHLGVFGTRRPGERPPTGSKENAVSETSDQGPDGGSQDGSERNEPSEADVEAAVEAEDGTGAGDGEFPTGARPDAGGTGS